ncbi:MAG TPA: hypothetical protein ENI97_01250 [Gammaproteobacteria bacterium]|nr:hypothetical protein [Gammaproteobacteria bacterium]
MKHIIRSCICIGLLSPLAANAADDLGRYAIHGAGLLNCKTFVAERKKASPAYMMMGGWMDGYLTAVNKLEKETYEMTPYASTELLAALINKHCESHPDDLLGPVMDAIVLRLRDDRLKNVSPMVTVRVGDYQTQVYAKTLMDMQTILLEKKMFSKTPASDWNADIEAALKKYQLSANLKATGFPDQKTLWHIFRSR